VASGDAHTRDSSVACYVSFETRAFEISPLPAGQGRYLPDDTVQFVSLLTSREPRSWRTIIPDD